MHCSPANQPRRQFVEAWQQQDGQWANRQRRQALSSNTLLSYEQSLDTMESIVKLTYNFSQQVSLVDRVGAENALGIFWDYSFGR